MRIGYACLTVGDVNINYKTCRLKNASEDCLISLITHNLSALAQAIKYNIQNNIGLFRVTSGLIPFASHSQNQIKWWDMFKLEFEAIGQIIRNNNLRISMHPSPYTILNSPNPDVITRAVSDLVYHNRVLEGLGLGSEHKIIIHLGAVYQNKAAAIKRFIESYRNLDSAIKKRLVLENDEKFYHIEDLYTLQNHIKIPLVMDVLHHQINSPLSSPSTIDWIELCRFTWTQQDGPQKIHYSQQDVFKKIGAHSSTIDLDIFQIFIEELNRNDIDIMLEVKDKNISALKCIAFLREIGKL